MDSGLLFLLIFLVITFTAYLAWAFLFWILRVASGNKLRCSSCRHLGLFGDQYCRSCGLPLEPSLLESLQSIGRSLAYF